MAIVTVSKQLGSLGDEIGLKIAENLGYKFYGKDEVEKRIVELGFPASKLGKFDEGKLGFFTGLTRTRDEYLNYLLTAILEAASENNCVIVGRASFFILRELENNISCRFIAGEKTKIERIQQVFSCNSKQAEKKLSESVSKQKKFYKEFFNFTVNNSEMFDLTLNTEKLTVDSAAASVSALVKSYVTPEMNSLSQKKLDELLIGQRIVDILVFIYNLDIRFLRTSIEQNILTLHGIAENQSVIDSAVTIVEAELPAYKVVSAISIAHDFKAY